ncbi:MAG: hypothetical protein ACMUIE_00240 [Thermoplasmatota archaeon]
MRRAAAATVLILIVIAAIPVFNNESEAVGTPEITISVVLDYPGYREDAPLDLSTGIHYFDEDSPAVKTTTITVEGSVEVSSRFPVMVQELIVVLFAGIANDIYGELEIEYQFTPEQMVFREMMPGETRTQNYTLQLRLDKDVPAGENWISIFGRWSYSPGIMGGTTPAGSSPLFISPVVSAGFDESEHAVYIEIGEELEYSIDILNNGNVYDAELSVDIEGIGDAAREDIDIEHDIEYTGEYGEKLGELTLYLDASYAEEEAEVGLELQLYDAQRTRELHNAVFTITMGSAPVPPPADDDDILPPDDDEPEIPIELLDADLCRRSYTDDKGDEVYIRATWDMMNYNIGRNPQVDVRTMDVRRDGEDLVIEINTGGPVRGWTGATAYILADDSHNQRNYYKEDIEDGSILQYEPNNALASNSIFASGDFWYTTVERSGSRLTLRGDLGELMEMGLDVNFEVFVMLADADPAFLFEEDVEDMVIELIFDYAGHGSGKVQEEPTPEPTEPAISMDEYSIMKYGGIALGVIALVVVVIISVFSLARRRKRAKYP